MKNKKEYDLEERTFLFSQKVNSYVTSLPKTLVNIEISKQLVRAAGSVGANYIEANECLGKRDFLMRLRISKKESKESRYWIRLTEPSRTSENFQTELIKEATELMNILGAILNKCQ